MFKRKVKPKFKRPKIVLEDFVYRIGKLSVGPNDTLILKTELALDKEQIQALRDSLDSMCKKIGLKNKIMIFTHGLDLMVLEKEEK